MDPLQGRADAVRAHRPWRLVLILDLIDQDVGHHGGFRSVGPFQLHIVGAVVEFAGVGTEDGHVAGEGVFVAERGELPGIIRLGRIEVHH